MLRWIFGSLRPFSNRPVLFFYKSIFCLPFFFAVSLSFNTDFTNLRSKGGMVFSGSPSTAIPSRYSIQTIRLDTQQPRDTDTLSRPLCQPDVLPRTNENRPNLVSFMQLTTINSPKVTNHDINEALCPSFTLPETHWALSTLSFQLALSPRTEIAIVNSSLLCL